MRLSQVLLPHAICGWQACAVSFRWRRLKHLVLLTLFRLSLIVVLAGRRLVPTTIHAFATLVLCRCVPEGQSVGTIRAVVAVVLIVQVDRFGSWDIRFEHFTIVLAAASRCTRNGGLIRSARHPVIVYLALIDPGRSRWHIVIYNMLCILIRIVPLTA